jgi:hypothetical protein
LKRTGSGKREAAKQQTDNPGGFRAAYSIIVLMRWHGSSAQAIWDQGSELIGVAALRMKGTGLPWACGPRNDEGGITARRWSPRQSFHPVIAQRSDAAIQFAPCGA